MRALKLKNISENRVDLLLDDVKLGQDGYNAKLTCEADTVAFGEQLAIASEGSGIVFLHGDLGMGKTTLCRGVLNSLGHQGHVKSPTYTLVEPYDLTQGMVYHFDLYRLGDPEELEFMGIRDYLDEQALVIIEWPEKGYGILPKADIEVTFSLDGEGRQVRWQGNSTLGHQIAQRLLDSLT